MTDTVNDAPARELQPHERWWEDNPERDAQLRAWLEQSGDDREFIGALADANPAVIESVLEVGPGLYIDHERVWSKRKGVDYFAVDVTPRFVAAGIERGLKVKEASVEALPFADHVVDLAYCRDVLEHLPHWTTALGELLRVARRTVAVRFFRLSPSAQDDVIAYDTFAHIRHLHHNTYAQSGIDAFLRTRGITKWEWSHLMPQPTDASVYSGWLTIEIPTP